MNLIQLALRDLILDTIKNIQKHNPGEIINRVATVSDTPVETNSKMFSFDQLDNLAEFLIEEFIN